jgi:superfamily II DNA or RNA helicase
VGQIRAGQLEERLVHPRTFKRDTDCAVDGATFTEIITKLVNRPSRNRLIAGDVLRATKKGRKSLVLTDRVDHCDMLADMLRANGVAVAVLHGQIPRDEREAARKRVEHGRVSVVVATGQLIGKGWDCPRLDTLFLATPLADHGRLKQYLGRVSRSAPGKTDAVVMDYTDDCAML